MARVVDPPEIITGEQLRREFAARWSNKRRRIHLLSFPEKVLDNPEASIRDKLDAWSKIVNRLGLTEKQQLELSGGLSFEGMLDVIVGGETKK